MKRARRKEKPVAAEAGTVTCRHCRYERPAEGVRCPICGYPWPWLDSRPKGAANKS